MPPIVRIISRSKSIKMLYGKRHLIVAVPLLVTATGLLLITLDISDDTVSVGVPAQDTSTAIAEGDAQQNDTAQSLFVVGICFTTLGVVFSLLGGGWFMLRRFLHRHVLQKATNPPASQKSARAH